MSGLVFFFLSSLTTLQLFGALKQFEGKAQRGAAISELLKDQSISL